MAKFTASVQTWKIGSKYTVPFEVPDDELEGLSEEERNAVIDDYAQEALSNVWEWGWKPEGES